MNISKNTSKIHLFLKRFLNLFHKPSFRSALFILFCLSLNQAYAIGDSDLKEQVTVVDSALKSIANPALWAVIIYIGDMRLEQSLSF
jgi:hypothetical protein